MPFLIAFINFVRVAYLVEDILIHMSIRIRDPMRISGLQER